ncbi:MAG TPA: outer-membrane lipoprotein carrier protein LolA [Steroidobacteraceae bacterium]|nr:outer-membrane lipoprotein carrier protein LolA [Steroidobacteraceae bacterium]
MRKPLLAASLAVLVIAGAWAQSGPTPLDTYLDNLKTLRASFQEVLVDSHGKETDRSTGSIVVVRPGKLRWEVRPQTGQEAAAGDSNGKAGATASTDTGDQLLVVDGKNVWSYDRDLQQASVKPVDAALSATPAMLLSGTVDVRKNFTVSPAGKRDGLEWVLVEPKGAQADFRRALFGFDTGAKGVEELKKLILDDKLGQTATIVFQKVERNVPVSPDEVSFTPPAGVDVIGTARK